MPGSGKLPRKRIDASDPHLLQRFGALQVRIRPEAAEHASAPGVSLELPGLATLQQRAAILMADGYFAAAAQ